LIWYNRLVIGILIGLAGNLIIVKSNWNWVLRGAVLGMIVSGAFFLTSGASDWVSFIAGIVYGVIIEFVLNRFAS
jgi:putative flippase GtrA